jgi:hypothetical protein
VNDGSLRLTIRIALALREGFGGIVDVFEDQVGEFSHRSLVGLAIVLHGDSSHDGNPNGPAQPRLASACCTTYTVLSNLDGMPGKRDESRLVATRISPDAFAVLQVALLTEGAESMQDLLRPVVEQYAAELAAEPEVEAIMERVKDYRARKAGVRRLRNGRQSRDKPSASQESTAPDGS